MNEGVKVREEAMKKQVKIIGIGIATMDIYCHKNRMYPGGNEYNIAYNTRILGAHAGFMGVFADDRAGAILEKTLQEAGVDTSHSHHEKGSSGYALVDLMEGERVFLNWNKQGVTDLYPIQFSEEEIEYIKGFDVACISWGARVSQAKIRLLSENGVTICYDFYDHFTDDDIDQIAPYIKYAFFSCSHLSEEQTGRVLKKAAGLGCRIAVGTRGQLPAIAYDGSRFYKQEVCSVKATDTMGAGDAYISGFLMNYLSAAADEPDTAGDKIQNAMAKAAEYAASVVVKEGALGIGYDVDPANLSELINL